MIWMGIRGKGGKTFIPFRGSVLTRVLEESLGYVSDAEPGTMQGSEEQ